MKPKPSMLLQLLRLNAGHYSEERTRRLMKRIHGDSRIERRWEKLLAAIRRLNEHPVDESHEDALPVSYESKIGAETLAAFIDETLDEELISRVERRAWKSDELLCEIVDAFQFHCSPPPLDATDSELNRRLEQLPSWIAADPPERQEVNGHSSLKARENHAAESTVAPPAGNRKLRIVMAMAVAAMIILCVSIASMLLPRDEQPTIAEEPSHETVSSDDNSAEQPRPDSDLDDIEASPESQLVDDLADPAQEPPQTPPPLLADSDTELPDIDRDAIDAAFQWPPEPEESPPAVDSDWVVPELQWQTVRGLLAYRDARSQHSTGYQYRSKPDVSQYLVTLPGSWAEAELTGSESTLVLDGDTSCRLIGKMQEGSSSVFETFSLNLNFGRAALKSLAKDLQLRIVAGPATWNLKTESDKTTLGVEWYDGTPRLLVRTGQIELDGISVKRNQQINWTRAGDQVEKLTASTAWSSKPDEVVRIQAKADLLTSDDLWRDLHQLRLTGRQSENEQFLALGWRLSLYPDRLPELLQSDDLAVRELAFQWLMSQSIQHPRGRAVFQRTARRLGNREKLVMMYRVYHTVQNGHPPERVVAHQLIESLNDSEFLIRHAAATILSRAFNENPVRFRADDAAQIRARKIQQWAHRINSVYDRIERAKQHRNGQNR